MKEKLGRSAPKLDGITKVQTRRHNNRFREPLFPTKWKRKTIFYALDGMEEDTPKGEDTQMEILVEEYPKEHNGYKWKLDEEGDPLKNFDL